MTVTAERAVRAAQVCESLARTVSGSTHRAVLEAEAREWWAIADRLTDSK